MPIYSKIELPSLEEDNNSYFAYEISYQEMSQSGFQNLSERWGQNLQQERQKGQNFLLVSLKFIARSLWI